MKYGKLNPWGLALSLGIWWAIAVFVMGLIAMGGHYGVGFVQGLGDVYIGYHASFWGSVLGAIWGFVDAFIGGLLVAWLYNVFTPRRPE